MTRKPIPTYLLPDELTDAQRQLGVMRMQGWAFWVMWLPGTLLIATLSGLIGLGFLGQFAIALVAMVGLVVARFIWWYAQRPRRIKARQDINRWRKLPNDQRWDATIVLLDRVVRLSENDPSLIDTAQRMIAILFSLYEDIRSLDRTIAADRVLEGPDRPVTEDMSERYYRLLAIRTRREAEIDLLINGLRDLHLEMSEQPNVGPLQDRLTEMMDRLEADQEVARAVGFRKKVLAHAQTQTRQL